MFGLPQKTLDQIVEALRQYPQIQWVKIYGSRARGNYKIGSDIDLAFSANENISAKLRTALDELSTPYLFDVTYYESLSNENLKSHIDRVGKDIYPV